MDALSSLIMNIIFFTYAGDNPHFLSNLPACSLLNIKSFSKNVEKADIFTFPRQGKM